MKDKIRNLNVALVNKMMEKYSLSYEDITSHLDENKQWLIEGKDWYCYYTLTEDEYIEFKNWAITEIKHELHCSKKVAEEEFGWWYLQIGLNRIEQ